MYNLIFQFKNDYYYWWIWIYWFFSPRILTNFNIDFEILDVKKSKLFPDKTKIVNVRNLEDLKNSISGEVVVNLAAIHSDDISNKKSISGQMLKEPKIYAKFVR